MSKIKANNYKAAEEELKAISHQLEGKINEEIRGERLRFARV